MRHFFCYFRKWLHQCTLLITREKLLLLVHGSNSFLYVWRFKAQFVCLFVYNHDPHSNLVHYLIRYVQFPYLYFGHNITWGCCQDEVNYYIKMLTPVPNLVMLCNYLLLSLWMAAKEIQQMLARTFMQYIFS